MLGILFQTMLRCQEVSTAENGLYPFEHLLAVLTGAQMEIKLYYLGNSAPFGINNFSAEVIF